MTMIDRDLIRTDGGTQSRADIDQHIVTEYATAIKDGATFPPIVVFHDGADHWLADGFHRLHAAFVTGATEIAADIRQGTRRDAILYSVGANAVHGLRRTNADKRRAVEVLVRDEEWGKWSANEIARRCGVAVSFAAGIKNEAHSSLFSENSEPRTYTTKHGTVATMNTAAIGKTPAAEPTASLVAPMTGFNDSGEPIVRRDDAAMVAAVWGKPSPAAVLASAPVEAEERNRTPRVTSESNEWYTPERYIEAARLTMGGIDLDPASCETAQATVGADFFFTITDDGLTQPWNGRVWMNPPYGVDDDGFSNQNRWCAKLIEEYRAGRVTEAIACVNALTYAPYFQQLWDFPICFTSHRIRFNQAPEATEKRSPLNGTAFVYLGKRAGHFIQAFRQFGVIVERADTF